MLSKVQVGGQVNIRPHSTGDTLQNMNFLNEFYISVYFSICVTVVVLNVHFRTPQTHTMAPWVRRLIF